MLAMNVVTVKEKTAREGKMCEGKMREGKIRGGKIRGGKMREEKMCEEKMCEEKMCGWKMCEGKRKWNCVSIYGMIGMDVRCTIRSEDRLNCVWNTEHETAPWHPGVTGYFRNM